MLDVTSILAQIFLVSFSFLPVHCSQPNCTDVADFEDCLGNVDDFCPKDIVCACKNGVPFCKCLNFRGQWGNYWYMGAKCEQLWSTLDLILVAVLPGIGLALIVGVIMQTVHYCRKSSKLKTQGRQEEAAPRLQPQPWRNAAYVHDKVTSPHLPIQNLANMNAGMLSEVVHASSWGLTVEDNWNSPTRNAMPRSSTSPQMQFSPRDLREDNHHMHPYSENFVFPEMGTMDNIPLTDLNVDLPLKFSSPRVPVSNHMPREKQQTGYLNAERPQMPFKIGRAQIRPNY